AMFTPNMTACSTKATTATRPATSSSARSMRCSRAGGRHGWWKKTKSRGVELLPSPINPLLRYPHRHLLAGTDDAGLLDPCDEPAQTLRDLGEQKRSRLMVGNACTFRNRPARDAAWPVLRVDLKR